MVLRARAFSSALPLLASLLHCRFATAQSGSIVITADLTECARRLYHAEIDIPVHAGPVTFTSPVWIPGSHSPNGPIGNFTGVTFTGGGRTLIWRRDSPVLSQFHVDVPSGVSSVHVHIDAIVSARATRAMAMLEWETLLLYPANIPVKDITIEPSVIVPADWGTGSALTPVRTISAPPRGSEGAQAKTHSPPSDAITTQYARTTVEQLEDSPVLAGRYFREYRLAPEITPPHFLDVTGDEAADATIRPEVLRAMENIIREARLEYGSFHYNHYHFLVTRSDYAGGYGGVEHAQSTNIGMRKNAFSDEAHQLADADLFAHEFTHSWNGKYRRPSGISRPDFATPVQSELLWIYEGMTQYLGDVLATRAGLKTQQQFREMLALTAAGLDYEPGRSWRSTEDTAIAVSVLRGNGTPWANWRRGKAFYAEGELLWLDVDTIIRSLTSNRKSLDDFERVFLGKGGNTGPLILPYDLSEVLGDLNQICPYDWAAFFKERTVDIRLHADLDGIVRGGYKLIYADQPTAAERVIADPDHPLYTGEDYWYSLGLRIDDGGQVLDVRWDSPADEAKLAPRQKATLLNGAPFSLGALHLAIADAKPIRLTLRQDGELVQAELNYRDGERFPNLAPVETGVRLLDLITVGSTAGR